MRAKIIKNIWLMAAVLLFLVGCGTQVASPTESDSPITSYTDRTATASSETETTSDTEASDTEATDDTTATADTEASAMKYYECAPAPDGSGLRTDGKLPRLHVDGTSLCNEWGEPVQLTGVSSHGVQWYPQYLSYETLRTLHNDWGTNVFRIAMYTSEGGYCEVDAVGKENYRNLISNCVDAATANNMYVIIDWHILKDGDPNSHKEEAKEFFTYFTQKYAGNTNVIYEICNEPNNVSWDSVKAYAEEIIPLIRTYDSKAVILVGTPFWSADLDSVANNRIQMDDNLMYNFHFYAQSHQDAPDKLIRGFEAGLPIFVSEYGLCDYSGNGHNDFAAAQRWLEVRSKYRINSCMWSLANKEETCCLLPSWCMKTSDWSDAELKEQALWLKEVLAQEANTP